MGFIESINNCFKNYATIRGRASRSEYWYFFLFLLIGELIFVYLEELMPTYNGTAVNDLLASIFLLVTILPYICVTVRRLHDINKSGWFFLLCYLNIIIAGSILSDGLKSNDIINHILFIYAILVLCILIIFLYMLIKKGDKTENRFGPVPT
jgi:uncharacterized membrane protein YhaH (DUF805 family)